MFLLDHSTTNAALHAQQTRRERRPFLSHHTEIADGQHGDIRRVQFTNQLHVSKRAGVARMIRDDGNRKGTAVVTGIKCELGRFCKD